MTDQSAGMYGCIAVLVFVGILGALAVVAWKWENAAGPQPNSPAPPQTPGDASQPPVPPFAVDPRLEQPTRPIYLADMSEFSTVAGPWPFTKGNLGNPSHDPIKLKGSVSAKGLSMHPADRQTTRAAYALGGKALELSGTVGLNDQDLDAFAPVVFTVVGDRKELWRSGPIKRATGPESFRVNVRGVQVLELRVTAQGSHHGAHAVWVDPVIDR